LYRASPVITLSESSKRELIEKLHLKPSRITVVAPGVDARFSPAGEKSPTPLVVAVGRLAPVKRFHVLIDALTELKVRHPALEAVIVGEGYLRDELEAQVREGGAEQWLTLPGHVDDDELVSLYRRAWVVCSTSKHEGWGMTLTEAGACGTPAVATRIAGHADAIDDGRSGLLVDDPREFAATLERVIADDALRRKLNEGALAHAARFTWGATAYGTLEVLAEDALRRRSGS
jgi:glycosyltransferase involved in cell wall biosynthesis